MKKIIALLLISLLGLSCGKKEDNVIKIGAVFALSGDYATFGQRAKNGAELAREEIKGQGNYNLVIKYEDSQGIPKNSVSVMNKLINIDKIKYVLGPLSSAEALSISPIAEKEKIIILTPVASSPAITKAGDYIFRNVVSDIYEGSVAASFITNELKKKNAAILFVNNEYGIGLKNSFSNKYTELGGSISVEESFNAGTSDFRTQILKIYNFSKKPEICILCGYVEQVAKILKQSKEMGSDISFLSFSPSESPEMIKIAGNASENLYYTYQGFDIKSDESVVKEFVKKYQLKYKEDPDIFAALTYDAVKIFNRAIEEGKDNREKVKEALYKIKDFPGVVGNTTFDSNGDVVKPIGIKQIKNGNFVWIKKIFKN